MGKPSKIRARAEGGKVEVKALLAHDMETGRRKNANGETVPAWFIQEVQVRHNGEMVLHAYWGTAVAKNPFLAFSFEGGKVGDALEITWHDNLGDSRTDSTQVV
ncbi:MAG: thiosulfate oxidation carrier complex protein SoxZ [Limnobacter sp.]|nr:thiosulfate oxidation carrier complex protein SoxZ [Limnobacter sp.]